MMERCKKQAVPPSGPQIVKVVPLQAGSGPQIAKVVPPQAGSGPQKIQNKLPGE
jgi:hypothetical protein